MLEENEDVKMSKAESTVDETKKLREDAGGLGPMQVGAFTIGVVDEIVGEGGLEIPGFKATQYEAIQIVKHWVGEILDLDFDYFLYGSTGSSEWRTHEYANRRLNTIAKSIGDCQRSRAVLPIRSEPEESMVGHLRRADPKKECRRCSLPAGRTHEVPHVVGGQESYQCVECFDGPNERKPLRSISSSPHRATDSHDMPFGNHSGGAQDSKTRYGALRREPSDPEGHRQVHKARGGNSNEIRSSGHWQAIHPQKACYDRVGARPACDPPRHRVRSILRDGHNRGSCNQTGP